MMVPRTDIHFHVFAEHQPDIERAKRNEDLFFNQADNQYWQTRIPTASIELSVESYGRKLGLYGRMTADVYFDMARITLEQSTQIDRVVLLALDALFDEHGNLDPVRTDLWVPNVYLARKIAETNARLVDNGHRDKRFLLGASVHPHRLDATAQIDEALAAGARLIKLIPSTQHIDLARVKKAYWRKLADNQLPVLLHVGAEYAFPEGRRRTALDHIEKMEYALDEGVTVIAAHCGARLFPWDDDHVDALAKKMAHRNAGGRIQLWGDTSALCMWSRAEVMRHVLAKIDPRYLVHGTDFPVSCDAVAFSPLDFPKMSWRSYADNVATKNPLDRDVAIKRAVGLPDGILTAAECVLRPI